ncbi:MAG: glycosyltransferase family 10 domain-containing protein [Opitutales bacterium]
MTTPEQPPLYLDVVDIGNRSDKTRHPFVRLLRQRYDVRLVDRPELLLVGHAGHKHRLYSCAKLFFTDEGDLPDFRHYDFAITQRVFEDPRHCRHPSYARWLDDPARLIKAPEETEVVLAAKDRFCAFFTGYANAKVQHRIDFFNTLTRRKSVDSCGKAMNTIGGPVPFALGAKLDFLRRYKFTIAFENKQLPGYITEKIIEPMAARSVPIYWGDPRVVEEFNPASFINANDFESYEALADYIIEVDRDDARYRQYLEAPFFAGNRLNRFFEPDYLLEFFEEVIAQARQRAKGLCAKRPLVGRWRLAKADHPRRPEDDAMDMTMRDGT